eukprot:2514312-Pleurochrysis_carterae.AAC.3
MCVPQPGPEFPTPETTSTPAAVSCSILALKSASDESGPPMDRFTMCTFDNALEQVSPSRSKR